MLKTLIRVGASWCAPCHIFAETFEKASKIEQYKNIDFKSVDIEDDNDSTRSGGKIQDKKRSNNSVPRRKWRTNL